MPPWKPDPGYGEFSGERRLTDEEIERLEAWVAGGLQEGDPTDLPPQPQWTTGWQLGEPDLILTLPEYTVPASGPDVFRNFVVPIGGDKERFVRGVEVRVGSHAVHHAAFLIDETPNSRLLDEEDPRPGYEGILPFSAQHPPGHFLGWTAGLVPAFVPKGLSWRLPQGADFVVQLHLRTTGMPERIQPSIGLFLTNEPPEQTPVMLRLGSQHIDIPAGAPDYRVHDEFVLPVDAQMQLVQPHAHYRGREVLAWATLPDGSRRWLIRISNWDFNWQDVYYYANPFWLPAGTKLEVTFGFDNSAENARNPVIPPRRVLWGPDSRDEMGDLLLQVLTRTPSDSARLVRDVRPKMLMQDIDGLELQVMVRPGLLSYRNALANAYVALGRPDRAVPNLEAIARAEPQSAVAQYNLGIALNAAGATQQAVRALEQALQLDENYAKAHNALGQVLYTQGRIAAAHAHVARAVALAPEDPRAHNNLGGLLLDLGRIDEAVLHLGRALVGSPGTELEFAL